MFYRPNTVKEGNPMRHEETVEKYTKGSKEEKANKRKKREEQKERSQRLLERYSREDKLQKNPY